MRGGRYSRLSDPGKRSLETKDRDAATVATTTTTLLRTDPPPARPHHDVSTQGAPATRSHLYLAKYPDRRHCPTPVS